MKKIKCFKLHLFKFYIIYTYDSLEINKKKKKTNMQTHLTLFP